MTDQGDTIPRRLERLEVLYKISNLLNTTLDPTQVLEEVLREVVRVTSASSASIAMVDHSREILNIETAINIAPEAWRDLKLEVGHGVTGWVAAHGCPLRIDDVATNPLYIAVKPDVRSELAVPMFHGHRVLGVINVDSVRESAFTEDDEKMLTAIAEQSARVIEMARLYSQLKRHNAQMESLFGIGRQLTISTSVWSIRALVVREGMRILEGNACALYEVAEDGKTLEIVAQEGADHWESQLGFPLLHGPIYSTFRAQIVTMVEKLQDTAETPAPVGKFPRSLLAVPVSYQDAPAGVLAVGFHHARTFIDSDSSLLQLLANQYAVAQENARRQERLLVMEESLNRAERFSLLGTLAAEIAHEIRNPVTIINLLLHSISEETEGNAQVAGDLRIVMDKLDRINRIVEQTLNIARNREPSFEPVCLNAIVRDLLLFLSHKLTKGSIECCSELDGDLPSLPADRLQIQQVLLNLMMNAIQAMPEGGRLAVSTRRFENENQLPMVAIEVMDSGVGIAPENIPSLFDPFFTTRQEGTGLGLFISRKMITSHGGELSVKSEPAKGSTFRIVLPLQRTGGQTDNGHSGQSPYPDAESNPS